ncbi:hypothetical protein D1610_11480 [Sphingomonas gilva]|uniref:Uncharacterized protein n=1 Tax=Sphingomonas gilva TaxID=2305907 RepID=A0A396RS61_9SPHN|nr:hypothetical protein [Sphingomonas gilva]RHW17163.1 hypothetical protein D1610_11480 [Sphingomonas gilva]
MLLKTMHREDVKSAIRKKYGSLNAFYEAENLAKRSVSDLFRGRTSGPTAEAVERVLQEQVSESNSLDCSSAPAPVHRPNEAGE